MKRNGRFYLAHSCELIDKIRKWEVKIEAKYRIDLINPFKGNSFENMSELRKLTTRRQLLKYMKTLDEETNDKIVQYDLELERKCDGVVAIFTSPSIGTSQEIIAGALLYQMPVYVICGDYVSHPWICYLTRVSGGKAFKNRREFEKHLDKEGLRRE